MSQELEQQQTSFAEGFWGVQDKGFDVLMERMKTAKHTCSELVSIYTARAEMEEDYAKRLLKLTKSLDAEKTQEIWYITN